MFLYWMKRQLGESRFRHFTLDLFGSAQVEIRGFEDVILRHMPGVQEDLRIWLRTTAYPERLRLSSAELNRTD